jgi:hypothetical protein
VRVARIHDVDAEQLPLFDPPQRHCAFHPDHQVAGDFAHADWTEEDVVLLHWQLLEELRHLQQAETPLEEKIDTLNWIFTEPDKDSAPFSFVRCLHVVGCSPVSPTPYFGVFDPEVIRDWIRANATRWMQATLERYPRWVRDGIRTDPAHVVRELERNPQWINEEIKSRSELGDLFA